MATRNLASLLLLVVLASCSSAPRVEEGFVANGDTLLYTKAIGRGEPIVILHGGPGFDHRQFLPQMERLAAGHRLIFFDQRGTGLSTGPVDSASITLDAFLSDIDAVREAFGIETMNLLGHSWGGILAMHYAVRHPDRLRSLVVCSAGASADCFDAMRANIRDRRPPEDQELLEEIYASDAFQADDPGTIAQFWRVYFRVYFADTSFASSMNLTFGENTIANGNTVARLILESVGDFDLRDDLSRVTCPTLVVHGDADPMPVSFAEEIHRSIPGSELRILGRSGHWIFVDATDRFCSAVENFLDEI